MAYELKQNMESTYHRKVNHTLHSPKFKYTVNSTRSLCLILAPFSSLILNLVQAYLVLEILPTWIFDVDLF